MKLSYKMRLVLCAIVFVAFVVSLGRSLMNREPSNNPGQQRAQLQEVRDQWYYEDFVVRVETPEWAMEPTEVTGHTGDKAATGERIDVYSAADNIVPNIDTHTWDTDDRLGDVYRGDTHYGEDQRYYAGYYLKNGLPVGIHELTEEERENSEHFYSIENAGSEICLKYLNYRYSLESQIKDDNRGIEPTFAFAKFTTAGAFLDVCFYDEQYHLVKRWKYSEDMSRIHQESFVDQSASTPLDQIDQVFEVSRIETPTPSADYLVEYDEVGRFGRIQLVNPLTDKTVYFYNDVAGFEYEYEEDGQLASIRYLVDNGQGLEPGWSSDGYAGRDYQYENGHLSRLVFLDNEGEPVRGYDGYAQIQYDRDEFGNVLRETYLGVGGEPTNCLEGYAGKEFEVFLGHTWSMVFEPIW